MTEEFTADPTLGRLADAVLIPPFPGRRPPGWIREALRDGLAGVTLFGPNVRGHGQLAVLTASLRAATAEPIIAIDEEGGDVTRISHQKGSEYPGNAALGAVDDVMLTRSVYAALGADLAALGVNLDLAPAVDVNTAADNPVIGTRAFGSDPALVARHAAAAVGGLQSAGVAACAKHFPGHGSTTEDSHLVLATVDVPLRVLRARDLPPFEAAIAAGVRAIMPSHLRVPELTGDLPASLSRRAQTGLLRGELGFTGVIVSDGLEMRAISDQYGIPEAAVQAVIAGTDLLCLGRDQDQGSVLAVRAALVEAVRSGRLPGERLEEAAARVADLRAWAAARRRGAGPAARQHGGSADSVRGTVHSPADGDGHGHGDGHRHGDGDRHGHGDGHGDRHGDRHGHYLIGLAAARRALVVDGSPPALHDPLVVQVVPPSNLAAGEVPWGLRPWLADGSYREISTGTAAAELPSLVARLLGEATGRSLVVVVRDAHRHPIAAAAVSQFVAARPDAVVLEMGLPAWRPAAGRYVASYGAAYSNAHAAAEVLGLTVR